jgi:hypothetical protein
VVEGAREGARLCNAHNVLDICLLADDIGGPHISWYQKDWCRDAIYGLETPYTKEQTSVVGGMTMQRCVSIYI